MWIKKIRAHIYSVPVHFDLKCIQLVSFRDYKTTFKVWNRNICWKKHIFSLLSSSYRMTRSYRVFKALNPWPGARISVRVHMDRYNMYYHNTFRSICEDTKWFSAFCMYRALLSTEMQSYCSSSEPLAVKRAWPFNFLQKVLQDGKMHR